MSSTTTATEPQGGFDLDGLLGGAGQQPAAEGEEIVVTDLSNGFTRAVATRVDTLMRAPGSELEVAVLVRCPIEPPLGATGRLSIKAARAAAGPVTLTMSGGLGFSLGDDAGAFGDLLGTASLQGRGADAERAAEMLCLALERFLRTLPSNLLPALLKQGALVSALPTQLQIALAALAVDSLLAGWIADQLFDAKYEAEALAGMKNGESAQFQRGGTIGGTINPPVEGGPSISGEGAMGVVEQQRIAKSNDAVTTTHNPMLVVNGKLGGDVGGIGGVGGGVDLQASLTPNQPMGYLKVAFKVVGDAAALPGLEAEFDIAKYVAVLVGAIAGLQSAARSHPDAANAAQVADTLEILKSAGSAAIQGAENMMLTAIGKAGIARAREGVELVVNFDFATKIGAAQFNYVGSLDGAMGLPNEGAGAKVGATQKLMLGSPIPIGPVSPK